MTGAGVVRSPPGATPVVKEMLSVWLGAAQVTRGKPDGYSTKDVALAPSGKLWQVRTNCHRPGRGTPLMVSLTATPDRHTLLILSARSWQGCCMGLHAGPAQV